jgi:hypothetical protein
MTSPPIIDDLRGGAIAYWSETLSEWVIARPGDALYSTVTFAATQHWDGKRWAPIYDDEKTISIDTR